MYSFQKIKKNVSGLLHFPILQAFQQLKVLIEIRIERERKKV